MNDATFQTELRRTFLIEAHEILDDTESAFLAIESTPAAGPILDKIFRLVHTIKGSAGMAGFLELSKFAHKFESLLSLLRDRKITINPTIIDLLLQGNDLLKRFVALLSDNHDAQFDTSAVSEKIQLVVDQANSPTKIEPTAPVAEAKAPIIEKIGASGIATDNASRTVLVVDDEIDIRDIACEMLEEKGYNVLRANSSASALAQMQQFEIDVILTDLKMPEVDGITFIQMVQKTNPYVPVIFISGLSLRDEILAYLRLGVVDFIGKPFTAKEVHAAVDMAMQKKIMHDAILKLCSETFKAYVEIKRVEAQIAIHQQDGQASSDQKALQTSMEQIENLTKLILSCERRAMQKA